MQDAARHLTPYTWPGASVIACKSFQVTAQKGRRTFKLIDSVLSTTDESGTAGNRSVGVDTHRAG